jgi:hypothetical protein
MSDQIKTIIERMEQLGPAQVRLLVSSGGLPSGWEVHAVEWLAKKDQEERRLIAAPLNGRQRLPNEPIKERQLRL